MDNCDEGFHCSLVLNIGALKKKEISVCLAKRAQGRYDKLHEYNVNTLIEMNDNDLWIITVLLWPNKENIYQDIIKSRREIDALQLLN